MVARIFLVAVVPRIFLVAVVIGLGWLLEHSWWQ